MFITSRSNVISIVLVIFSTLFLLCSSFDNSITYKVENGLLYNVDVLGVYADGSTLFELFTKGDYYNYYDLRLLKPDGSIMVIETPNIFDTYVSILNPNYIILSNITSSAIMDWTGNIISTMHKFSTFEVSKKNDSKFLTIDYKDQVKKKLYTEYTVSSDSTGKIVMNAIQQTQTSIGDAKVKEIFSLNYAWIVHWHLDNTLIRIEIISAEKEIIITHFKEYVRSFSCSTDNNNNFQYYCLWKTVDNKLELVKLTISNNKPFMDKIQQLTISEWSWIDQIITISGGLLMTDHKRTTYYIMNAEIDYTNSNALGELVIVSQYPDSIYILPNNTMVNIKRDESSITFLSTDLTPMIPPKSMYSNFLLYYIFIIAF
jgi:hypothetical protein